MGAKKPYNHNKVCGWPMIDFWPDLYYNLQLPFEAIVL